MRDAHLYAILANNASLTEYLLNKIKESDPESEFKPISNSFRFHFESTPLMVINFDKLVLITLICLITN